MFSNRLTRYKARFSFSLRLLDDLVRSLNTFAAAFTLVGTENFPVERRSSYSTTTAQRKKFWAPPLGNNLADKAAQTVLI